jgi:hypothetical protein
MQPEPSVTISAWAAWDIRNICLTSLNASTAEHADRRPDIGTVVATRHRRKQLYEIDRQSA